MTTDVLRDERRDGRRAGRPRSADADRSIVVATAELFAELGFDGLTVEGVATRAGVGKATIYRRYPGKVELVMAAVACLTVSEVPSPDTGSLRGDLAAVGLGLAGLLGSSPAGAVLPQLVAAVGRDPELAAAHRAFVRERRERTMLAVRRAIERGELDRDADPELVVDCFTGPIFYRHLVSGGRLDRRFVVDLVERVVAAFAPSR